MRLHAIKNWLPGLCLAALTTSSALADPARRMVVLGIDGMDPVVLQRYIDEGLMPNLERLAGQGGFMPLGTTVPPQSPVAWSSFITGMNPGGHGLYDFLALDRETMEPYMSSVRVIRSLDWGTIELGGWQLPIVAEEAQLLRKGKAFWEVLGENGVATRIFRVPAHYPPTPAENTRVISGMGTPDLKGSSGTFAFFTDDPRWKSGPISGGEITRVAIRNNEINTTLKGLANPFRTGTPDSELELTITLDKDARRATITYLDESITLDEGDWSDWHTVEFELIPSLSSAQGIVRFYLQEIAPNFRLYASPVNIDPRTPAQAIAAPVEYAAELAEHAGPFYTQEMPEDTKALSGGVLKPSEFIEQSSLVLDERRRLLKYELQQFKDQAGDAFLFFYFSSLDLRNHMLARQQDPDHPYHESDTPAELINAMRTTYQEMDAIVGGVMQELDDDTAIIVMSDHGFSTFRTQVNLNSWLEQEGYLKLLDADARDDYEWLENVDWSQTRAFAIGLNSLYINVEGRDKFGIVPPADREALASEIVEKLAIWKDAETDKPVVTQPLTRENIYSGAELDAAPDVLVGYGPGYRSSWATTSGRIPADLLEPNMEEWSGDHCIDAREVPGVLLSNQPLLLDQADLRDLTAAIISYYNIDLPDQIEGQPAL